VDAFLFSFGGAAKASDDDRSRSLDLRSANATQERQTDAQLDWGLRTNAADVVNHLRADFDRQWAAAA
jgi:hypothetical protein